MRKFFQRHEDFWLKVLAFIFAVFLWFFVVLQEKVERDLFLRVVPRGVPSDLILLRAEPPVVRVRVVGPRSILRGLPENAQPLFLDLSHLGPGRHQLKIPREALSLPPGLQIRDLSPSQIEVVLDQTVERWIRVKADLKGVPPGYVVKRVRVIPPSVKARGARQILRSLENLYTRPIDISGKTNEFQVRVSLVLPEGVVEVKPQEVTVKVELERKEP
ncbi:YbbR-like domain-containing protein [Thermosulfurimonas marina]|uniref:YbbR-like domain-containing protein n=1 Tax=Thermosulfurimonas marina TaxID=2047767 RepID=A0A6H1WUU1_9BACT|nr:CdaR family protein [Thermosulfurimonas marina]QJA06924.1 YbbR-like domain-containing protein [Thermosulfurimonas marina]